MDFLIALMQIMMVNIVLSGDNAVVIALAARNLPVHQQKQAVLWGSGGAIVLRVILTIIAVALLKIPFLQFFGALLLIWIAIKLLIEDEHGEGEGHKAQDNLLAAVKTILVADVVMSLDNTLAIAGIAKGDWALLITGLVLSIPLIVFGSTIIMKLIARYPVIVYIGAGLIAYTAGEMIEGDQAVQPYLPGIFHDTPYLALLLTVGVIGYGWWRNRAAKSPASPDMVQMLDDDEEHVIERG
ncbi:TerC family protein [Propionivibrio dicarboxylicus]|uniref:Integral membrane protein, YjbE family n=1 Tax=Propionivibrio dicarboxylicus TaxID=83767 RepID=A0A1G8G9Q4_9RHOO|nr:TerC family protein [Propionivibrio dicarboxylicus]SDH91114.1 integral membrane protein, YjbE family [Propionivibrio dicarboxylicus]